MGQIIKSWLGKNNYNSTFVGLWPCHVNSDHIHSVLIWLLSSFTTFPSLKYSCCWQGSYRKSTVYNYFSIWLLSTKYQLFQIRTKVVNNALQTFLNKWYFIINICNTCDVMIFLTFWLKEKVIVCIYRVLYQHVWFTLDNKSLDV